MLLPHAIVVGGGLTGLAATISLLGRGANVLLLEKYTWGGNSMKATSGMNAAPTKLQAQLGVNDSASLFYNDTYSSAGSLADGPLIHTLTYQSADAAGWLEDNFDVSFTELNLLGGSSVPRTHSGAGAPGATITNAVLQLVQQYAKDSPERLTMFTGANVTRILKEHSGVTGVEYTHQGRTKLAIGPVIVATGGYAADFTHESLIKEFRPDLFNLPTTNGNGSEGYGHRMVQEIGGALTEPREIQVHPTALVNESDPDAKTKFLLAEAMRGAGSVIFDSTAHRFVNELEKRDVVSDAMLKHNKAPYWQVLNGAGGKQMSFYTRFYQSIGLMYNATTIAGTAKLMNVSASVLGAQFKEYINIAEGRQKDPFGRTDFVNYNLTQGPWYVAQITRALHYTMGGIKIDGQSRVISQETNHVIPGLFAAGEAAGGVHGVNRLGGSGLLTCIVFGRQAAESAAAYLLGNFSSSSTGNRRALAMPVRF